jgi:hypothetical protein
VGAGRAPPPPPPPPLLNEVFAGFVIGGLAHLS